MVNYIFYAYLAILFVSFIVSVISTRFNRQLPFHIKLLPWFLLFTFVIENVGFRLPYGKHFWIFNLYNLLEFSFYSFLLYNMVQNKRWKRLYKYMMYVFFVGASLNMIFGQGLNEFDSMNFFFSALLLVAFSIVYMNEMFGRKDIDSLATEYSFWIAASILLFHSCSIPVLLPVSFEVLIFQLTIVSWFLNLLNCVVYSMFIVAFLCPFFTSKQHIGE